MANGRNDEQTPNDVKSRWRGAIRWIRDGNLQDKLVAVMKSKRFKIYGSIVAIRLAEIYMRTLVGGLPDVGGIEVVGAECKIQTGSPHDKDMSVKSISKGEDQQEFKETFGVPAKPDGRTAGKSIKCVSCYNSTVDEPTKCGICGNIVGYKTDVCELKCMYRVEDVGMVDQTKHETGEKDLVMARQYVGMADQVMSLAAKFVGRSQEKLYYKATGFAEQLLDAAMDKAGMPATRSD